MGHNGDVACLRHVSFASRTKRENGRAVECTALERCVHDGVGGWVVTNH